MTAQIISAFTDEQAARLTGLTVGRLQYWDRTGFFVPSLAAENRRTAYSRIYTFRDLLSLQVLKGLRVDRGCSLPHLREVKEKLRDLGDDLWSRTTLHVLNRKVVFYDEETDEMHEPVSGQNVLKISLKVVLTDMESAVKILSWRDTGDIGQVERRRNVNHNAPVVAGTRIPVAAIKRLSEDGFSVAKILEQYPSLKEADVEAARQYTSEKSAA